MRRAEKLKWVRYEVIVENTLIRETTSKSHIKIW